MNNIVSKILIVANLVFSLCFMCFAGAVFSFQAGWVQKYKTTAASLATAKANYEALDAIRNALTTKFDKDLKDETMRADNAEAKVNGLQQNLSQEIGNLTNAEKERDKHLADLLVAQTEAQARITETNDSRAEIKRLRDQNNDAIAIRRGLEDKNLQMEGQLADAGNREVRLLQQITDLNDLLRLNKIDPRDPVIGPVPRVVERVDGFVEEARKNASRSAELVQITIGKDDGVFKNMQMTVYRGAKFIARIRIIEEPLADKAIGQVIEETRNGTIERGDNVTTKF